MRLLGGKQAGGGCGKLMVDVAWVAATGCIAATHTLLGLKRRGAAPRTRYGTPSISIVTPVLKSFTFMVPAFATNKLPRLTMGACGSGAQRRVGEQACVCCTGPHQEPQRTFCHTLGGTCSSTNSPTWAACRKGAGWSTAALLLPLQRPPVNLQTGREGVSSVNIKRALNNDATRQFPHRWLQSCDCIVLVQRSEWL